MIEKNWPEILTFFFYIPSLQDEIRDENNHFFIFLKYYWLNPRTTFLQ